MAHVCAEQFVEVLNQTRLLDPEQEQVLPLLQQRFAEPRHLAGEMIRRGWLTPYQVNNILQGRTGDLMVGPYVLLERLGEGGMGQVFKARQRHLNRLVALKTIHKSLQNNPRAIPRFHREAQAAGQLSHPNIVRAFDAGEIDGTLYLAMEYVQGVDLNRMVKQFGPLQVEQACDYIRQAALGLEHAHQRDLVHRDIKPANLLVTRQGTEDLPRRSGLLVRPGTGPAPWGLVKVLDLGLARCQSPTESTPFITQMGTLIGTPDFLAPEQARNCHTSDIRADLYSLGCTFYFLLTGRPPFPGTTLTDKLLQHQLDEPEPVEEVRREVLLKDIPAEAARARKLVEVPRELAFVIRKLMSKRPEERHQSPGDLATVLATWLKGHMRPGK